jgi:hypothetical protein
LAALNLGSSVLKRFLAKFSRAKPIAAEWALIALAQIQAAEHVGVMAESRVPAKKAGS